MRARISSRLAWVMFGFVALFFVGSLVFSALSTTAPNRSSWDLEGHLLFLAMLSFPVVGVLIASRQPGNAIGWILLGTGLAWQIGAFVDGYAGYGLKTHPGSLPYPELLLALFSWWWVPAVGLMGTFLILLFPDGRLPSTRWRSWGWLSAIAMIISSLVSIVTPGPMANLDFPNVLNPLGVDALQPILDLVNGSVVLLVLSILGCVGGLTQRFRRSRGQERLQLKWLTAGAAVAAAAYAGMIFVAGFVYPRLGMAPVRSDTADRGARAPLRRRRRIDYPPSRAGGNGAVAAFSRPGPLRRRGQERW